MKTAGEASSPRRDPLADATISISSPGRVRTNAKVDDILTSLPKQYPVFAFLDLRGAELSWQTIVRLARHKPASLPKIELFILFAYNQGIVRLMPHDPAKMVHEEALDRVMPDPEGWRRVYAGRVSKEL